MALSKSELDLIASHSADLSKRRGGDILMQRYYQGQQRLEQLGMAIPPQMRNFVVIANWARVLVDTIDDRQQVRSLILPGQETADAELRAIWDASNLSAHVSMFNRDRMVFGRAFMSVGTNMNDRSLPWVRVESPLQMSAFIDTVSERITSACRLHGPVDPLATEQYATLYLPDATIWATFRSGRWVETARDDHQLGSVPVVMHLNRRLSSRWDGESEMADIIPLVDAGARSLTNLQFAQEAHGVPARWATGVSRSDFTDSDGNAIPQFEAYFDAISVLAKSEARWGQFSAADLKNFETAISIYARQASVLTGFPARYWGITTANPPAEGAIHADEATLNRRVEAQNEQVGMTLGWVAALAYRFATGDSVDGNRVRVEWFDPATPTVSQREDALAKRRAAGVLSMEGYWDELGWSEARKAKERQYLAQERRENLDPYLATIAAKDQADEPANPAEAG